MATALENGKITGTMGVVAALAYIVCMLVSAFLTDGFEFGVSTLDSLGSETIYVAGCAIAGILGAVFGVLVSLRKVPSKTFIEKVRGVLIIVSALLLIVIGVVDLPDFNEYIVWAFIAVICLTVLADVGYDWVTDQKVETIISAFLLLVIVLTGCLSQGNNVITQFAFVIFVAIWVIFISAMYFAPVAAAPVASSSKKNKDKDKKGAGKADNAKKNAPAPRPYPSSRPEAKQPAKPVAKEQPKKVEVPPKREEPVKVEEPKVVIPPKEEPKKEELPKLKVMSSREAAMARDARRKEEEPVKSITEEPKSEPVVEPVVELVVEPIVESEAVTEDVPDDVGYADSSDDEGDVEDFDMYEDTPDALLRRATWNKGLRCRRDYGDYLIPIAFVKAKVAVYITDGSGDTSKDDALRSEGWTVFRYLESDITDGKDQAEEINKAVKDNLKAERASKKKKGKSKK